MCHRRCLLSCGVCFDALHFLHMSGCLTSCRMYTCTSKPRVCPHTLLESHSFLSYGVQLYRVNITVSVSSFFMFYYYCFWKKDFGKGSYFLLCCILCGCSACGLKNQYSFIMQWIFQRSIPISIEVLNRKVFLALTMLLFHKPKKN
jgi:hypothetical protein